MNVTFCSQCWKATVLEYDEKVSIFSFQAECMRHFPDVARLAR